MKYKQLGVILLSAVFTWPAQSAETKTYKYDAQGRLVEVKSSGNVNAQRTTTYTFDRAHNRTREKTLKGPPAP